MAAYLEIYERFKKDIVEGVYMLGDKLPSKRTLSEKLQTSVITVQHAYQLLIDEGYIETRERSGYYVIYKANDFLPEDNSTSELIDTERTQEKVDTVIAKGAFSFDILSRTMRRVLLDYGDRILVKSPNTGCEELRQEIQTYLAKHRGIHVSMDQIIIGSGAEYLYSLVAQLFDSDTVIAVENPGYSKIRKVYEAAGHEVESLKLGPNGILSSELLNSKAGVLHVTPFHSYPSQVTADVSKKLEYCRWAGNEKYIVEDNYDSELTVSRRMEDALFAMEGGNRVIYINTFSKTIAPSIRVGYMILPENLLQRFHEKLGFYSCTVPVFEQYVLAELFRNGDFERHINRVRRQRRKNED